MRKVIALVVVVAIVAAFALVPSASATPAGYTDGQFADRIAFLNSDKVKWHAKVAQSDEYWAPFSDPAFTTYLQEDSMLGGTQLNEFCSGITKAWDDCLEYGNWKSWEYGNWKSWEHGVYRAWEEGRYEDAKNLAMSQWYEFGAWKAWEGTDFGQAWEDNMINPEYGAWAAWEAAAEDGSLPDFTDPAEFYAAWGEWGNWAAWEAWENPGEPGAGPGW
jgi:hypothetical protein